MTDRLDVDVRVSPEGRVVIPAAVRAALGIHPGDRIRLTVQEGEVHLVPARSLIHSVWANNTGGDAGDSVQEIRAARTKDQARVHAKWDRIADTLATSTRSEEDIATGLLTSLGLAQ